MSFTLCLFLWKTLCKHSFAHFPVFGSTKKKIGQWKTIFSQRKILIKIRLIFYRLFSNFFFFGKQSLSHALHLLSILSSSVAVGNIIFWHLLSLMVNFLTFSLFPLLFFHLTFSLSLTLVSHLSIDLSL